MINMMCDLPKYQHIIIIFAVQLSLGLIDIYILKNPRIKASSIAEIVYNKIKKWASITKPEITKEQANGIIEVRKD